jgi:hypothetical protein
MSNSYTIPDPRDWADIILDDAPPCPPQYKRHGTAAESAPRPYEYARDNSLLAKLLPMRKPFTADDAAKSCGVYASSVRACIRNYPARFRRVNAIGSAPALWQVVADSQ